MSPPGRVLVLPAQRAKTIHQSTIFFVGRAVRAPALARQRRVRGATPTRLPASRRKRLASVAVSLPQIQPSTRGAKARTPAAQKRRRTGPMRKRKRSAASKRKWGMLAFLPGALTHRNDA